MKRALAPLAIAMAVALLGSSPCIGSGRDPEGVVPRGEETRPAPGELSSPATDRGPRPVTPEPDPRREEGSSLTVLVRTVERRLREDDVPVPSLGFVLGGGGSAESPEEVLGEGTTGEDGTARLRIRRSELARVCGAEEGYLWGYVAQEGFQELRWYERFSLAAADEGGGCEVALPVRRGVTARGVLLGADGEPTTGMVHAWSPDSEERYPRSMGRVRPDGAFELHLREHGSYLLTAEGGEGEGGGHGGARTGRGPRGARPPGPGDPSRRRRRRPRPRARRPRPPGLRPGRHGGGRGSRRRAGEPLDPRRAGAPVPDGGCGLRLADRHDRPRGALRLPRPAPRALPRPRPHRRGARLRPPAHAVARAERRGGALAPPGPPAPRRTGAACRHRGMGAHRARPRVPRIRRELAGERLARGRARPRVDGHLALARPAPGREAGLRGGDRVRPGRGRVPAHAPRSRAGAPDRARHDVRVLGTRRADAGPRRAVRERDAGRRGVRPRRPSRAARRQPPRGRPADRRVLPGPAELLRPPGRGALARHVLPAAGGLPPRRGQHPVRRAPPRHAGDPARLRPLRDPVLDPARRDHLVTAELSRPARIELLVEGEVDASDLDAVHARFSRLEREDETVARWAAQARARLRPSRGYPLDVVFARHVEMGSATGTHLMTSLPLGSRETSEALPPGEYVLEVELEGGRRAERPVVLVGGETLSLRVDLGS